MNDLLLLVLEDPHGHGGEGFFTEYFELLTNPAHIAFELTLMAVVDLFLLGLLWPLVRRYIKSKLSKQHEEFDREHGIHHHDDHIHIDPEVIVSHDEHPDHD